MQAKIELKTTRKIKNTEREYRLRLYFYKKNAYFFGAGLQEKPKMGQYIFPPTLKTILTHDNYRNEILREHPNVAYIEILAVRTISEIINTVNNNSEEKLKKDFFERKINPEKEEQSIDFSQTLFEIKKSKIEGEGLFVKEDIKKEEVLFVLDGEIKSQKETGTAYPKGEWNALGGGMFLIRKERTIYAYINHSRTPNAYIDTRDFTVKAKENLSAGEEITLDYRKEALPKEYLEGFGKTYL